MLLADYLKRRRTLGAVVAVVGTAVTLAACGSSSPTTSASSTSNGNTAATSASGSSTQNTTTPLTISQEYIPAVTNLLPILAPQYASRFNLTINSTKSTNVQSEITAAVQGAIDVFPATPAGVIIGRSTGLPLVMLASGATGSTQLLTAASLNVTAGDWAGLKALVAKDKAAGSELSFGSAVAGSANFIECQQSLAKHGITVGTDVKLVTLQNFPDQPAAIEQGQVQILCTPEPFATNAINSGKAKFFATPFDTASGDILGAITTTQSTLNNPTKREALRRYLETLQYVAQKIAADPSIAVQQVMQLANANQASAQRMLEYTHFTLAVSKSNIVAMAKAMFQLGQTSKDLSGQVGSFIDTSLLPAGS